MTDDSLTRRRALALAGAALTPGLAGCLFGGDGTETPTDEGSAPTGAETSTRAATGSPAGTPTDADSADQTGSSGTDTEIDETDPLSGLAVAAERVASGFTSPVGIEIPETGRRFVVDQPGQIRLHDEDEGLHDEPFLDLTDETVDVGGYDERGLLGLAFHPEFDENGRLYVRYSAPRREGTPESYAHTFVLSEFHAEPDAARADPDSERTILEIPQPQGNHNAGAVAFGPDGYLYVATGDGGAANDAGDGHVSDWYDAVPGGNGQDVTENLLGSILRIDVDGQESDRNYAVPDDNPLVGEDGLDEQYAWGFRNPWRLSFGPDGRLFVADVGQDGWEEVSVVEKGGNYGWNVKEGTHCFGTENCPDESPDGRPLGDPVIEYPHDGAEVSGVTVIGGYLYDGEAMPDLQGLYVFADWLAGGELFAARETDDGLWETGRVTVTSDSEFGPNVLSFGRNPDGELFVCTTAESGVVGNTGAVFRLNST